MDGAFAAVVGALIGATAAYWLAWLKRRKEDTRKRRAIASAVLAELYSLSELFDELTRWRSKRTRGDAPFPSTAHERLIEYLEFLEPPTTYAILGVVASINDIRRLTKRLDEGVADEGALRAAIERRAREGLDAMVVARDALLAEGAELPPTSQPPGDDEIDVLQRRVRRRWDPQTERAPSPNSIALVVLMQ